jgi:hypothetical protein
VLTCIEVVFQIYNFVASSRGSAVGIAIGYGLDDRGGRGSSPGRVKNFHFSISTGSGVHPASYTMGIGGSFFGGGCKVAGREADHSPPTSAEVKKTWTYTPTPAYVFMA